MLAGYPGTAAVIPEQVDCSNCADLVVITPSADLNAHMLAAVFNSAWGRSIVGGQLVGSAQQHFNVGSAKALRVRLPRSEEHTSELQSLMRISYAVFCLKKKKKEDTIQLTRNTTQHKL